MASLKEIKARIGSIRSTMKITSAMKVIASTKIRKAQLKADAALQYEQKLEEIINLLPADSDNYAPATRETGNPQRIALIILSSDSGLCGGFNKEIRKLMIKQLESSPESTPWIIPIGKKIVDDLTRSHLITHDNISFTNNTFTYQSSRELADELLRRYNNRDLDRIQILYHPHKATGKDKVTSRQLLPYPSATNTEAEIPTEPSPDIIRQNLLHDYLTTALYSAFLSNQAAEHSARSAAMQMATNNADNLLQELTISYNKTRQQVITNELADMMGSFIKE